MFEWLSDHRADIAAVVIVLLVVMLVASIVIGRREANRTAKDHVFGDPERTRGGWYWAVAGVSTLLLVWFYFSWGVGRAYFPQAANEMCQVAKLEEVLSPVKAALPIGSRYYKSTLLVGRNATQLKELRASLPTAAFSEAERKELLDIIDLQLKLIANSSDPGSLSQKSKDQLVELSDKLRALSAELRKGPAGLTPTPEALAQPKWGTTYVEIPLLPTTARGVLFDNVTTKARDVAKLFYRIRNHPPANTRIIADLKERIKALKQSNEAGSFDDATRAARADYVKGVERIFRRLDDGTIFPAKSMDGVNATIADLDAARDEARGSLGIVEALFFPVKGVVKSRTQCTEQGSARWLPKPTDVVAKFMFNLANPDV